MPPLAAPKPAIEEPKTTIQPSNAVSSPKEESKTTLPTPSKIESAIPVLPSFAQMKKKSVTESEEITIKKEVHQQAQVQLAFNKNIQFEDIKAYIAEFSEICKLDGRMIEFAILSENDFSFVDATIQLQLDNELAVSQLNQFKTKLQDFFKSKTGNVYQIDYKLQAKSAAKTLYSANDKYNYIKELYPEIEELKRRLGLEIEH